MKDSLALRTLVAIGGAGALIVAYIYYSSVDLFDLGTPWTWGDRVVFSTYILLGLASFLASYKSSSRYLIFIILLGDILCLASMFQPLDGLLYQLTK